MSGADIFFLVVLLIALYDGWRRGVIKILGSIGSLVIGIFLARRVCALLMPMINQWLQGGAEKIVGEGFTQVFFNSLLFSDSGIGKLVEVIIFVTVVVCTVGIVRYGVNIIGNIINMTPLIGWCSRVLGLLLSGIGWIVLLYAFYNLLLPWFVFLVPEAAGFGDFLGKSTVFLPVIQEVGSWVWLLAASSISGLTDNL